MRRDLLSIAALLGAASVVLPAQGASPADPVRLLSSNGVRTSIEAVQSQIEAAVGHPLSADFTTAASLKRRIDGGEAFDVAILTPALVDDLVKQGKLAAASRVDIARTGVGIGMRAGAPRPDVSTPDALKRTLLNAKSVAYTAEGQSRATVDKALARLGIADAVGRKAMLTGPGEGPAAVAAGKADLVLTLVSEILVPGVQLIGPFPADLQDYVTFTAARSATTRNAAAADALLRAFNGPQLTAALKTHGMERP